MNVRVRKPMGWVRSARIPRWDQAVTGQSPVCYSTVNEQLPTPARGRDLELVPEVVKAVEYFAATLLK